ncbi:MAG: quinoprotein glucose dehydrogenase [Chthoniobacter sp.]|nr:quinoprotein glucose dehydrogenase [Chthoniobacter sp.]
MLAGAPETHAAEISAAGPSTKGLKPPERVPEPKLAAASDDPEKQRKKFKLDPGFEAKLWAAEPMLGNPVSFSIDEKGVIYVAETYRYRSSVLDIRHYMFMLEDDLACRTTDDRIASIKKNFPDDWQKLQIETEVVRRLEDKDGSGTADVTSPYAAEMTTLLDGINSGVLAHDGKVWCTNIPNLWQFSGLKDGKAEKRESLSFGYGVRFSFTGHDMHGLALGPDGRLYFSFGDRGAHVKTKEGGTLAFSDEGAVFRCERDGSHLEAYYHGLRNPQELAFDNHGNLFTGDNDCDMGDRERWVYLVEGGDSAWRVGWQHPPLGKDHDMWLVEKMWEPRKEGTPFYVLSPILNIPDGPSGVVHNPGTGLPPQYDDAFFVCGFKGSSARSGIAWWTVKESGAGFVTVKPPADFVGSVQATDVDFGPDSRMYFTEWGEGWEGTGRGRIFRLDNAEVLTAQAAQIAEVKKLLGEGFAQRPSAELAKLLAHGDQRIRLNAQWALAGKSDAAASLLAVAKSGETGPQKALSRLHGIWGLGHVARLEGYKSASAEAGLLTPLVALLADPDAEVRAQAAKALGDGKVAAAYEALVKALKDENARVKFFAAQSLGKLANPNAAEPILAMLRENADQDQFIRHAGVMALLGSGNQPAIFAAAKDSSPSVRLAALLALRRQQKPEVAQLLTDSDPRLVKEAARAINDEGIAGAFGDLAKLIEKPVADENLMLRVINANFRAGTAAAAQDLADYAVAEQNPEALRLEALFALGTWAKPPQRDRVAGVFRPLGERDSEPAVAALKPVLPGLLAGRSAKVAGGAIEAVFTLGATEASPALFAVMSRTDLSAKVRGRALETLAAFEDPKLPDAIKLAFTDKDPALRIEASAMLGRLDPEQAAKQLSVVFASAEAPEKKQIIVALGDLKGSGADKVLSGLIDELKAGKIPVEAQLELVEAAAKRKSPEVKTGIEAWLAAQAGADKLGRFSFVMAGGDRGNGEKLFKEHAVAQCFRCHKVQGVGGDAGPDLTGVGTRQNRRYLLESIVDPNATIAHGFDSVMCTLTSGDIKAGILKAETADALILQVPGAGLPPETVKKSDIKSRDPAPSGMPPGLGELLSKRELRDILEYIASLK